MGYYNPEILEPPDPPDAQDVALAYLMGGTERVATLYSENPITPETSLQALKAIQEGGGDLLALAVCLSYIHSPSLERHGPAQA
jgi:hypothetical protein